MEPTKYLNKKGKKFTRTEIRKSAERMDYLVEELPDRIILRKKDKGKFVSEFIKEVKRG